jgi:hypothetical protein
MGRVMIRPLASIVLPAVVVGFAPATARADEQSIIRSPGDHPAYIFEAEPHLLLGYSGPFEQDGSAGVGFRGTVNLTDGFVKGINDSVGIGFGIDIATDGRVLVPVVMQWNFWLSTHWSVFGEPGLAIGSGPNANVWPVFYGGGRFHFTDRISLTLRIGYPDISVGVSFLL